MSLPRTMRAVICPEVPISPAQLVYSTTHPTPQPKAGHVLIRVKAFGLNRSELYTRQGQSPGLVFPRILGIECVGIVQDAGGGTWKEGDVIAAIMGGMGRQFDGGYAEYTLIPHANVSPSIKLPKNMGWETFAAIPETFMTAWGTLHYSLKLTSKDTLFIRGGSSSLGLALTGLAKSHLFNASAVLSTTRAAQKIPVVQGSGADHVILDTPEGSISAEVKKLTSGKGATKAVELVGPPVLEETCAALAPDGVVAVVGSLSGIWRADFDPMSALAPSKYLTMFGSNKIEMSTAPLQDIVDAVGSGEIKLNVDKVFNIRDTGKAQEYMEANSAAGKVVCLVD